MMSKSKSRKFPAVSAIRTAFIVFLATSIGVYVPPMLSPSSASPIPDRTVIAGTDGAMMPHGSHDLHMRMTPTRPATRSDIERANQIATQVRRAIAPYRDVRAAQKDGYLEFPPDAKDLDVIHYTKPWLSVLESRGIDPEHPSTLVYKRQPDGSLRLIGAMFQAPAEATLEELDKRIPLSIARWHLHVNICVPEPLWDREQWARKQGGKPVFGPDSPIATEAACKDVGGKFLPTAFGWMVHVNVFADDPAAVWDDTRAFGHGAFPGMMQGMPHNPSTHPPGEHHHRQHRHHDTGGE